MVVDRSLKSGIILIAIIIIGGISFFTFDFLRNEKMYENWIKEYPEILLEEKIDKTVISVIDKMESDQINDDPNSSWIQFEDSTKRRVKTSFGLNAKITSDDAILIGTRLVKEAMSDKLIVLKIRESDTIKYEFLLRDRKGYPLKKSY